MFFRAQPLLNARIVFFVYFRHYLLNMKKRSGRIIQKNLTDAKEKILSSAKTSGGKQR